MVKRGDIINLFLPANLSAQKEKPPEINDFRGSLVAGVVLLSLWLRESIRGALLQKALVRCAHYGLFLLTGFANKFAAAKRKKPSELSSEGFL